MKDCPVCGTTVDGPTCPKCSPAKQGFEAHWWRCSDTDRDGNRCSKPGAFCMGTMNRGQNGKGDDGPWFCAAHFPPFRGWHSGVMTPPPPGWNSAIKRPPLRLVGAIAEDVLERAAIQGEPA